MNLNDENIANEIIPRPNPDLQDLWPVGIDFGTDTVKGFAPNKIFRFPNCAVKLCNNGETWNSSETDILLRDGGETWLIGNQESALLSSENNSCKKLFEEPAFPLVTKAALGISLLGNSIRAFNGEPIYIQTGLPCKNMKKGSPEINQITHALAGNYDFELKTGTGEYTRLKFRIEENNIALMMQPKGALYSAVITDHCEVTPDTAQITDTSTLVLDAGFTAVNTLHIANRERKEAYTYESGILEILRRSETCAPELIDVNSDIYAQKDLGRGNSIKFDEVFGDELSTPFAMNTKNVFKEVMSQIIIDTSGVENIRYLIISGGASFVWIPLIRKWLEIHHYDRLTIIKANRNDKTLSDVYSNVRGYYMALVHNQIRKRQKSAEDQNDTAQSPAV